MTHFKILVVDNDPDALESLVKGVLESEGYVVFQAQSPEEARQILEKRLIHLAILDIRLIDDDDPHDESGLKLSREIGSFVAKIMLTGYLPGGIMGGFPNKTLIPFADRFIELYVIEKGSDPGDVLAAVKKALTEKFEGISERRIAVLTSGGDSPGMNAAIRAIVRVAMDNDIEVIGIEDGYKGLVYNLMHKLTWNEVSDILAQSGTILGTARLPEFSDPTVREKAIMNIRRNQISGLIVIGGDGSMQGAQALMKDLKKLEWGLQTIAIPGTIDNDLWGTDMSLGAASAANAMIEEMRNMLRPAQALRRIFVCEVMGRYCGYLAVETAMGVGADVVIILEQILQIRPGSTDFEPLKKRIMVEATEDNFRKHLKESANLLKGAFAAGKGYGFVVMSEGIRLLLAANGLDAERVRRYLEDDIKSWQQDDPPDVRAHVVGYPVRGVRPCRFDLWLGARLGAAAVQGLLDGKTEVMVGWSEAQGILETSFDEVVNKSKRSPQEIWNDRPKWQELLEMQEALACPPSLRQQLKEKGNRFVR